MKRRLLSLFVAFAMTISMVVVGAGAVEPTYGDTAGHWAESAIDRWSGHGIIQGSNGEFDPNGPLTCAQLATILAKLLKLPAATDAGFTDNAAGAWYYDAINRCAAAGILNGNGDGTVDPNGAISRERAMVMLGRALGIQPLENPDLTKFSDAAKVASYAQGMVAALIEKGVVGGVTSDTLAPQDDINRASTVTILDRAIRAYADKTGGVIKVEGTGIVIVVADDVTITGDVEQVIVPADNVDVTIRGCEGIDSITVTGENSKVILENSSANDVTLDSKNTEIETKGNSKVDNVSVSEDAAGATVNAGSGTTIGSVENKAEDTTVTGNGSVKEVASDKDMTVETKNTEVKNTGDEKISVTDKNGKTTETAAGGSSTTTGGSSGSSSGSSSHSHSYDATTHKCSCGQADPAHAVASVSGMNYLTLSEAITAAQAGNKTMTLAADKTTTESIQAILDGQYGSINGLTIELPSGNYGELKLARVVAETKDGLTYTCNHTDGTHYMYTNVDEYKSHLAANGFHFTNTYTRTMSGVKLVANGDVTINGLLSTSGHLYQEANPFRDGQTGYYFNQKLTGFTFEGIKFVRNVNINTSSADTEISNFTFKNCSFTTEGTTSDKGQAIRYYNENNNGKVSDLKVINCTFNNCYQGVYTMKIKNVSVTGSSFDTTGHNAIAVQGEYCNHGAVQITGNTFANIGDRIIRFNNVGANTQITITNNTATNSGRNGEVIKAESLAQGATYDIRDNSWDDANVNIPSDRVEMSAQIGEAQYATLAAAIAAATDGDTVKLLGNVTLEETIQIGKTVTLDISNHTITANCSKAFSIRADGTNPGGSLAITGNGTINANSKTGTFFLIGSDESDANKVAKLSIGKNVSVTNGFYAIWIDRQDEQNYSYNIIVDVYGNISADEPIYVSGNIHATSGNIPKINIHDGATVTVWGEHFWEVYLAGYAKTTIENGAVITNTSGNAITICAGELVIDGGNITGGNQIGGVVGTGGAVDVSTSSAVFVKQHSTNLPVKVTINDGSFTAAVPFYQATGANGDSALPETVTLSINGGTFTSNRSNEDNGVAVKSDNKTAFITGGTFSAQPEASYLAAGFTATENNGTWTVSSLFAGGTGTAEDPFKIENAEQLKTFREKVNAGDTFEGKTVKLTADINLNNEAWTPIGNATGKEFAGTFDGQDYKITGLTAASDAATFGLFGKLKGTVVIKNFKLEVSAESDTATSGWAGVVGQSNGATCNLTLEGITVKGTLRAADKVAGLIAQAPTYEINGSKLTVRNCVNEATVTGTRAAGICCSINTDGGNVFENCVNKGTITATEGKYRTAAGILCKNEAGTTFTNCRNEGVLNADIAYSIATKLFIQFGSGHRAGSVYAVGSDTYYYTQTNPNLPVMYADSRLPPL